MLKIKRTLNDHIKEKDFSKIMFINPEQIQKFSGNFCIRLFNHILSPSEKFLRETFNAIEGNKILAQISLVPDRFSKLRYQISSLKIRHGYDYVAKNLIDFVINKYGGNGVKSFMVYVEEAFPNIISLFKNECGFRSCAKIEFYITKNLENNFAAYNRDNFKDFQKEDIISLLEINTMNIFPHFRPALISKLKDFKHKFLKQTQNDYFKVFQVAGKPEGYFRLYSNDSKNYFVDIITSKAYETCYGEIISYIQDYLKTKANVESLTILLKKYRETATALANELKNSNYKISHVTQILVKDYWQKIPETQNEEKLFVFFNDLTSQPARYNSFML